MFLKGHFIPQRETNYSKILEKIEFDKSMKKITVIYYVLFFLYDS